MTSVPEISADTRATVHEGKQWIETSDVIPTFPTLVWKLQIEAGLRDTLAARIRRC